MTDTRIKALLIECDPGDTLGGSTVRDVHNMAEYLIQNKITTDIQILLTDLSKSKSASELDVVKYGRSRDIFSVIDSISLESGDRLLVLLSGHGYTKFDRNNDEIDRRDEYINVGFQVTDDDLYERIVLNNNVDGVDILMLVDTCHSGTMLDLPYSYDVYQKKTRKISKRVDDLELRAMSVGACQDSQLSMCDFGSNAGFGGSLTVGLLEYPDVLNELISMRYDNLSKLFDRLKLLNQRGVLSVSTNKV